MARLIPRATRRLLPGLLLVAIGLAVAPTALAGLGVTIAGFAFDPSPMTVHVGDTVAWTNSDAVNHTATADDASWNTGTLSQGETSNGITFNTAGTFAYHCAIHSAMHGTIIVAAAPPATDTVAIAAPSPRSGELPIGGLALVALGGFVIGRRRFGGRRS